MIKLKNVNLIPKEALRREPFFKKLSFKRYRNFLYGSIVVLFLITVTAKQAVTISLLKWNVAKSKKGLQEAKLKLNQLQTQHVQLGKIKDQLLREASQKKERLDLLGFDALKERSYSRFMATITELVPQDLWINELVFQEEAFEIGGSALDNQLITQFMNKLDESRIFRNSRFTSFEKKVTQEHTLYRFQITTEPLWGTHI